VSQLEKTQRQKAVLVGVQVPTVSDDEHTSSLAELGRLAHTLGFDTFTTLTQRRSAPVGATVVGEGKLQELARLTGGRGVVASGAPASRRKQEVEEDEAEEEESLLTGEKADIVIFDEELTPTQLRNLESATGVEVLDRTGVIIEIFHRHAKTRQAKIQVEIARLRYLAPRLRMSRVGQDRQGGGIGSKGAGETTHELDKRRIRDRIAELKKELEEIHGHDVERREQRKDQPTVALVGYTNAGKSSLMRALTDSQVYVEDKLFATLDTTVRAMQPETHPRILISDTVGFIKKLPHDLVASFRSTLDEASDASLLLYVVDASDPTFRSQLEVTREVLSELSLDATESFLILNKSDRLEETEITALLREFPRSVALSAQRSEDIRMLRDRILTFFEKDMVEADLMVPYKDGKMVGDIHRTMRVLRETHTDEGSILTVRAYPESIAKMTEALLKFQQG
jgi:GTP-binding protein HflX